MNKNYSIEAHMHWGDTAAYREHAEKTKHYTKEQWDMVNNGLMSIFAEFSACKNRGSTPDSPEAQALVTKLQAHITEHYYTCTPEILAGLGKMYVCDERFKNNIDQHGTGTAEFTAEAIAHFCGENKNDK